MTEVELAKLLRKSNYTCEGVNCDECKKTNYIHECLMADVRLYCDDILGADDNYIEKLEKENITLLDKLNLQNQRLNELKKENEELKKKMKGFVHLLEGVQFTVHSNVDFETKVSWIEENTIRVFKNEKQNGFPFDWIN